jgi:hypothetical protein
MSSDVENKKASAKNYPFFLVPSTNALLESVFMLGKKYYVALSSGAFCSAVACKEN